MSAVDEYRQTDAAIERLLIELRPLREQRAKLWGQMSEADKRGLEAEWRMHYATLHEENPSDAF